MGFFRESVVSTYFRKFCRNNKNEKKKKKKKKEEENACAFQRGTRVTLKIL
jgi:hypothetical protein